MRTWETGRPTALRLPGWPVPPCLGDYRAWQRPLQFLNAGVCYLSARKMEPLQALELLQILEAGIRDVDTKESEVLQAL